MFCSFGNHPYSLAEAKERILHIRGRKFVMDGKGKTIRPASHIEDGSSTSKGGQLFARVDIGGVTFTRRNDNTLVRTNTHYARNILRYLFLKFNTCFN